MSTMPMTADGNNTNTNVDILIHDVLFLPILAIYFCLSFNFYVFTRPNMVTPLLVRKLYLTLAGPL